MNKSLKNFYLAFFFVALFLAGIISFYASSNPDGLEKVAEEIGFIDTAKDSAVANSPLSDYGVIGITNERLSVGISGVIGVVITAIVAFYLFKYLAKSKR
jgi:cobalt/nickel transport protein